MCPSGKFSLLFRLKSLIFHLKSICPSHDLSLLDFSLLSILTRFGLLDCSLLEISLLDIGLLGLLGFLGLLIFSRLDFSLLSLSHRCALFPYPPVVFNLIYFIEPSKGACRCPGHMAASTLATMGDCPSFPVFWDARDAAQK